jgi:hypothetical protein
MNQNINYNLNIIAGFTLVGILTKLFVSTNPTEDGINGPATSSIWGYGVVVLSLIATMFISFSLATKIYETKNENGIIDFLKILIMNSLPTISTLLVIIWILVLNITYYKKINEGKIATEYYQFSTITTILIILQLIILFMSLFKGNTQNKMAYTTYAITLINMIFVGIMNIIVTFFSTDG